jgi:hypothetical protein
VYARVSGLLVLVGRVNHHASLNRTLSSALLVRLENEHRVQLKLTMLMEMKDVWAIVTQVFPAFAHGISMVPFDRPSIMAIMQLVCDSLDADPTGSTTIRLSTKDLTSQAFYFRHCTAEAVAPPYSTNA